MVRFLLLIWLCIFAGPSFAGIKCKQILEAETLVNQPDLSFRVVELQNREFFLFAPQPYPRSLFIEEGDAKVKFKGKNKGVGAGTAIYLPPGKTLRIQSQKKVRVLETTAKVYVPSGPILIKDTEQIPWSRWSGDSEVETKFVFDKTQDQFTGMVMGMAKFSPGVDLEEHYHLPGEIYYILKGVGLSNMGEEVNIHLYPGKAKYVGPSDNHYTYNHGNTDLVILFFFPVSYFSLIEYIFNRLKSVRH